MLLCAELQHGATKQVKLHSELGRSRAIHEGEHLMGWEKQTDPQELSGD
jgi:hypothetical protein